MPSSRVTHFTWDWAMTSRSKRSWALGPAMSCRRRLPLIPSSTTATGFIPGVALCCDRSRSARKSGQRRLASTVEAKPSVIESPRVTTATVPGRRTSTSERRYRESEVVETGMVPDAVKSPGGEM